MKIYARDIMALIVFLGGGYLLAIGHNGWIQGIIGLCVAYYFIRREKK